MDSTELRLKAEEILRREGVRNLPVVDGDFEKLIQELAIFHIELEYQNEELLNIQNDLYAGREELADLFNSAPIGYFVLSQEYKITRINDTACKLLQTERKKMLNHFFSEFIHPDCQDTFYFHLQNVLKLSESACTIRLRKFDNEFMFAQVNSKLSKGQTNELVIRTSVIDISEQKNLEIALTEAKEKAEHAEKIKTAFVSNLSHEVRTPMNAIQGFASLLARDSFPKEQQLEFIEIITKSSFDLLKIMESILELSEIETGQSKPSPSEFSIENLLSEIAKQFRPAAELKNLRFILNISENESHFVFTDYQKLHKIISNLTDNAIKFTENGFVEIGFTQEKNNFKIYVKDSGIGIADEMKQCVFESFLQEDNSLCRRHGGLGIGLTLVREYAKILKFEMCVDSQKDKGSHFEIEIPSARKHAETEHRQLNLSYAHIGTKTVLVAEDEDVNYLYIKILIEDLDPTIELLRAENGMEAIEIVRSNANINLVLMDIKMPVMDGFEATRQIKRFAPTIPVVGQTAYASGSDKYRALQAGCDGYLVKPIAEDELVSVVTKYLKLKV